MLCVALLKAVGLLWLKLDISSKKIKQDARLLAVFPVTATNLPLSATWGLSHSPARMDYGSPDGCILSPEVRRVKTSNALADAGHSCSAWHEHHVGSAWAQVFQEFCLFRPAWAPAWGLACCAWAWHPGQTTGGGGILALFSLLMICSKDDFASVKTGCGYAHNSSSSSVYRPSQGIEQKGSEGGASDLLQ